MHTFLSIGKRYKYVIGLLLLNTAVLFYYPTVGEAVFASTRENALEMLGIIPPVFLLLGLLDVWIDRETMIKYQGKGSGIRGALLAFILGSAAAGPLYAAFPVAGVMLHKGASLFNIFIFIGAWSTTKIPLLIFETASLGIRFTAIRFIFNIVGIIAIAFLLKRDAFSIPQKAEEATLCKTHDEPD